MSTSNLGSPGEFRVSVSPERWTWSERTYALYGFDPGEVVPTTELVLAHQHADDRAEVADYLLELLRTGRPAAVWHRLADARGGHRQVVTMAAGEFADDGTLVAVSGHMADVSEPLRLATSRGVDDSLEQMSQSRPLIEQAKGALMVTYALGADDAFTLLRRYSQTANVKLRDVARVLVESSATGPGWPTAVRETLDALVEQPGATADHHP